VYGITREEHRESCIVQRVVREEWRERINVGGVA